MVFNKQVIFILSACLFSCMCSKNDTAQEQITASNTPIKMNGVSLVAPRDSISNEDLNPLYNLNPNWVSLMPFGFMKEKDPNLRFNAPNQWWGERENGVRHMTRLVKDQQIKVMLKPQIWVYDVNLYTGYIVMENEANWKAFEAKYRDFALFYANLAQELNIEMFCIGTELEGFVTARPQFWTTLIDEIKSIYDGELTYASNWDEYKRVQFWNQLDFIGVDAYFPVSDKQSPNEQDIVQGWQEHIEILKTFSNTIQKPMLFTEYGYRSMDYCGKEPWDSGNGFTVNMDAQVNGYKGFFNSVYQEDWMKGGFLWKWFTDYPNSGGPNNNRFTPQNKPVEETIKHQFSQQ